MATTKNGEVVDLLQMIGDLMELRGDASYRVRAYREAARQLDLTVEDVATLSREDRLTEVKGVGPSIARTIKEYLETGRSAPLDALRQEVPEPLTELLGIRHFGPQRIVKVHRALGVTSLDELEGAARDGRLAQLSGFGQKSVETLLASIRVFREQRGRIPRYLAEAVAYTALHGLRQMGDLTHVAVVGGIRRLAEAVERIDILAASQSPAAVMEAFSRLSLFREVAAASSIHPPGDGEPSFGRSVLAYTRERYPVLLRVVPPPLWGQALQQATGSTLHNDQLRERALALGLHVQPVPPAHVSRGAPASADPGFQAAEGDVGQGATVLWPGFLLQPDGQTLPAPDEAAVYSRLGLPVIPPELREGRGEIVAALTGRLPRLIELADIRGDLHLHTSWSDGSHSIVQMAHRAQALGREYIAIADHSQSLGVARGLTLDRLAEQRREIAAVDAQLGGIRLLSSVELDIKSDGTLDYPDEVLAGFDFVTASIHSGFQQPGERLTQRVIAAMRSPHVDAIGHLTGRVLGRRDALDMDVEAILRLAAETDTAMEINAWPNRLDLHEGYARPAKELGVKLVINTDSHADDQLEYMRYGVEVARRAWVEPGDVLNTLPLDALMAYLKGRRHKA